MRYLFLFIQTLFMSNLFSQDKVLVPKVMETDSNKFIYYYFIADHKRSVDDIKRTIVDENFVISDSCLLVQMNDKESLLFERLSDYEAFRLCTSKEYEGKSYHIFRNLNKYGEDLIPRNFLAIINPFLNKIDCKSSQFIDQIKYVNDYATKLRHPLYFYRQHIAEISLLIHLFFIKSFPSVKYELRLEENTYIPYLVRGQNIHFILANLLQLLFENNEFDDTLIRVVEVEFTKFKHMQ